MSRQTVSRAAVKQTDVAFLDGRVRAGSPRAARNSRLTKASRSQPAAHIRRAGQVVAWPAAGTAEEVGAARRDTGVWAGSGAHLGHVSEPTPSVCARLPPEMRHSGSARACVCVGTRGDAQAQEVSER